MAFQLMDTRNINPKSGMCLLKHLMAAEFFVCVCVIFVVFLDTGRRSIQGQFKDICYKYETVYLVIFHY